jgi:hypothetical protein
VWVAQVALSLHPVRPANRHPDSDLSTASDNGRDNANLKRSTNEHTDNCIFFFVSCFSTITFFALKMGNVLRFALFARDAVVLA